MPALHLLGSLVSFGVIHRQVSEPTHVPCARGSGEVNDGAWLYRIYPRNGANYTLCLRRGQYVDDTIRKSGSWSDCDYFDSWTDKSAGIFLDVGTNIGACSVPMYAAGHRVISFEPTRSTFAALSAAVQATSAMPDGAERRGTIRLINKGASNAPGSSVIYTRPGNSGDSISVPKNSSRLNSRFWSVVNAPSRTGRKDTYVKSTIELTTLDAEVTVPVDFMKMDAQGHEVEVLRGADKLIKTVGVNKIFFEYNPPGWREFGHEHYTILEFLHERGYHIYPGHSPEQRKKPIPPWEFRSSKMRNLVLTGKRADFIAIKNGVRTPWKSPSEIALHRRAEGMQELFQKYLPEKDLEVELRKNQREKERREQLDREKLRGEIEKERMRNALEKERMRKREAKMAAKGAKGKSFAASMLG